MNDISNDESKRKTELSIEDFIQGIHEDVILRCIAEITELKFDFTPDQIDVITNITKFKNFECAC